uniref:Uncharacterized protein n=1 Tax=Macrostomum lignano TaxID=282301 RepID=A0A1I8JNG6_9PLAT
MKQLTAQPSWPRNRHPTADPEGAGSSNGNSDNRNRDEACELKDLCKFAEVSRNSSTVKKIFASDQRSFQAVAMASLNDQHFHIGCHCSGGHQDVQSVGEQRTLSSAAWCSQDVQWSSVDADSTVLNLMTSAESLPAAAPESGLLQSSLVQQLSPPSVTKFVQRTIVSNTRRCLLIKDDLGCTRTSGAA